MPIHRFATGTAILLALIVGQPASGQETVATETITQTGTPGLKSTVRDQAHLFSAPAIAKAEQLLRTIEGATGIPVVIETVPSLEGKPINDAALEHAKASGGGGVFLLIAQREKDVSRPLVHREFAAKFSEQRRTMIRQAMLDEFNQRHFDAGLKAAVQQIAADLGIEQAGEAAVSASTDSPLIVRNQVRLSLAGARKVIAGAEAKAAAMGLKVNIAIVDDGGHLLAFARMDGARPASGYTALTKATTAATFRQATGPLPRNGEPNVLLNLSLQNAAAASGAKLTTLHGGVPIVVDDQVIGAVGVGGGTGEQDAEVGRAGIQAFLDELNGNRDGERVDPNKF